MRGTGIGFALLTLAFVGCDSGECVLDTDCPDFGMVCIESRCVPPGALDAGGRSDGAVAMDAGGDDAGAVQEDDAGQEDAAVAPDAGPGCPDLTGDWVAPNTMACFAETSYTLAIAPSVAARRDECQYAVTGGLMGTFSVDAAGAITGVLGPDERSVECTGTRVDDATIELTCGGCALTLNRA